MENVIEDLKLAVGDSGWLDPIDRPEFIHDIHGAGGECLLILRPATTGEVSQIVRLCHEAGIGIIPQGGNSNVCRMAVPTDRTQVILLSLHRMSRIIDINVSNATATVEAGCVMQSLQEAAAVHGLVFAPDWGARGTATVGGAVATNGGGLNVLRYGTTREQVLGIEAVLPDGRVWNGLRALVKDNSGFDIKQLFIGSEGTLGVITRIVFRLHPRPAITQSMMIALPDVSRLVALFRLGRDHAAGALSAFELLPGLGVEKALSRYPDLDRPMATRSPWYVLIRMSDRAPVEGRLMSLFEKALEAGLVEDGVLALSGAQESNLWEIREQMIPHQYFPGFTMLKWDVSVPGDRISDFLVAAQARTAEICPAAICYAVSHVGDGNIHYNVFLAADVVTPALTQELYDTIDALIFSFGGSVVAEHGVGALFRDRVKRQKSAVEYDLLATVKRSFDPQGVMNPGKMLCLEDQAGGPRYNP